MDIIWTKTGRARIKELSGLRWRKTSLQVAHCSLHPVLSLIKTHDKKFPQCNFGPEYPELLKFPKMLTHYYQQRTEALGRGCKHYMPHIYKGSMATPAVN